MSSYVCVTTHSSFFGKLRQEAAVQGRRLKDKNRTVRINKSVPPMMKNVRILVGIYGILYHTEI